VLHRPIDARGRRLLFGLLHLHFFRRASLRQHREGFQNPGSTVQAVGGGA
jgi:hypothetical protein